jgi:hypothetical protein
MIVPARGPPGRAGVGNDTTLHLTVWVWGQASTIKEPC